MRRILRSIDTLPFDIDDVDGEPDEPLEPSVLQKPSTPFRNLMLFRNRVSLIWNWKIGMALLSVELEKVEESTVQV